MKIMIKNWFLEKEGFSVGRIEEINSIDKEIKKETEKAVLLSMQLSGVSTPSELWVPKSCLTDKKEKIVSPFAYHEYLVNLVRDNNDAIYGDRIIKSGRNRYLPSAFIHQEKTKSIQAILDHHGIEYMTYKEFKNRDDGTEKEKPNKESTLNKLQKYQKKVDEEKIIPKEKPAKNHDLEL